MNPPSGPASHHFSSQRLRINYLDWGNSDAPLLLFVHGGNDHARSWDRIAEEFRHDYHVIAPDLRGHGDSAWSPDGAYHPMNHVYDLAQLLHQRGDERVRIVGHSFGGMLSLRYAGLFPERVAKLVLIEGTGFEPDFVREFRALPVRERWRAWIEQQRALAGRIPRRYASIEEALARMQAENLHLTEEWARHLTIHGVNRNEDGTYSWKFDNYGRISTPVEITEEDRDAIIAAIDCPVLLCWGRDSWAIDPATDGTVEKFRNARRIAFDDAGHWLHHDKEDEFIANLRLFLRE